MPRVQFECSCGDFVVEINEDWAPIGADRFMELVRQDFFNDVRFFRVVTKPRPFIVQFGINGDPETAAQWRDNHIQDDPLVQGNEEGTLTFATSGPNTRTTQLFVNYGDNTSLDAKGFSVIGKVVEGMDTVRAISDEYGEKPNQSLVQQRGNAYLNEEFPNLDYIKSVIVLEE